MNRIDIKTRAKSTISANLGISIIAYLVYTLVVAFLSSTGIGSFVVGFLALSLAGGFLKMLRTGSASFEDFINTMTENAGTKFVGTLLVFLYTWLWSLLFVIPGIVKGYSYAMTNYILIDRPELTASQAIDESKKMMNGHKMELFVLDLSFIGWYLLGYLTCGILLFWSEPYHMASRAAFYEELKGPEPAPAEENPEIVIPE